MNFYTIGVYGSEEQTFFDKLSKNNIDTFIDIRRRRAVRGSKYSFVNSTKLQNKLKDLGIKYKHILELAPTNEIRDLQKKDDKIKGIIKRERTEIGHLFKLTYKKEILSKFDLQIFINDLITENSKNIVLFCVEEVASACHRHIVTDEIKNNFDYKIIHL